MLPRTSRALVALAALVSARTAAAEDVQLSPFAGVHFGGSVNSSLEGQRYTLGEGFTYGATLDIPVVESWRIELLYSRQETELESRHVLDRLGVTVERYMVGIQEEKGPERSKFFGVFLLGATRFIPRFDGYSSDLRFTGALSLGVKHFVSERFGLRAEARAFYVNVVSGGELFCSGGCLYVFHSKGLWQGDVSGGFTLRF